MVKISEIWIRKADVTKLYDWVEENEPYEACALLVGTTKQSIAIVEEVILTPNISKSRAHFEIEPVLLYKIHLEAEEKNKRVVSIFHSHPISPYPSGTDVPYMQVNPGTVWLIRGIPRTEPMHGFQWVDDKIVEVKVKITH